MVAKSDKVWKDAIAKAIYEYREETDADGIIKKVRWINVIAAQLVRLAGDGDVTAIKEIGDRLDGKPTQSIESNVNVTTRAVYHDPTAHLEENDGDSIH